MVRLRDLHAPISLYSLAVTLVRVWVLLRFILSRTVVAIHQFVRPQREINLSSAESLQLRYVLLEFFLVFFIALAEISLLGEVNRVVTWLITRGIVVLRLLDSDLRI